jgi:hypothetical protein
MMFAPESLPPPPHLARLPASEARVLVGDAQQLPRTAGIVDITAWPCHSPCVARTATMAALAHGSSPPPLVTLFTTPPDAHPAIDAAQAVSGWTVLQVADAQALHAAWFAARDGKELPNGGLLVVDHEGSVRAVVPASPEGVEAARRAWQALQSNP